MNNLKIINIIRQLFTSLIVMFILVWAFFKNQLIGKIIILPFFICSLTIFIKDLCLLLKKEKLANIFKYVFYVSFFIYVFGILIYTVYYAIKNQMYSLFIIVGIFAIGIIPFVKSAFFNKKK